MTRTFRPAAQGTNGPQVRVRIHDAHRSCSAARSSAQSATRRGRTRTRLQVGGTAAAPPRTCRHRPALTSGSGPGCRAGSRYLAGSRFCPMPGRGRRWPNGWRAPASGLPNGWRAPAIPAGAYKPIDQAPIVPPGPAGLAPHLSRWRPRAPTAPGPAIGGVLAERRFDGDRQAWNGSSSPQVDLSRSCFGMGTASHSTSGASVYKSKVG